MRFGTPQLRTARSGLRVVLFPAYPGASLALLAGPRANIASPLRGCIAKALTMYVRGALYIRGWLGIRGNRVRRFRAQMKSMVIHVFCNRSRRNSGEDALKHEQDRAKRGTDPSVARNERRRVCPLFGKHFGFIAVLYRERLQKKREKGRERRDGRK